MTEKQHPRSLKSPAPDILFPLASFFAGALAAFADFGQQISAADGAFMLLLRPLILLGEGLRAWSLSGAAGNAAAWAVIIVLSLLPCVYVLIARRKQTRRSDLLFPLLSAFVFLCLYLLVNPSLVMHPLLAASASAEQQRMAPALVLCCALTACVLIRWADGLTHEKPLSSLLKWLKLLLLLLMMLTAASAGYTLCMGVQSMVSAAQPQYGGYFAAYAVSAAQSADAWAQPLLSLFDLTVQGFLLVTLHCIRKLCGVFEKHGFHSQTEECAAALAVQARHMLIALCACMALKNIAAMLLGRLLSDLSVSLNVPLVEMAFACGTLLLAHCIAAACRLKRENELII